MCYYTFVSFANKKMNFRYGQRLIFNFFHTKYFETPSHFYL